MLASIVVAGWLLSAQFSILHVFNLALCRPSSSALWYLVVGGAFLSLAAAGRFLCGWLCPFGALAEFLGRIPVRKWTVPAERDAAGRELKYVLLGAAAAAVLISGRTDYGNYEVYVTLFALQGSPLAWLLVLAATASNLRVRRCWCRYLCPVAALTALLSRSDPAYISRADCPMGNKPNPETAECIRCNRCYPASARG
jgi:polyferredoxin